MVPKSRCRQWTGSKVLINVGLRYGYEFKDNDPSFDAGVFAINLKLWRKGDFLDEALYWMKQVTITTSLDVF